MREPRRIPEDVIPQWALCKAYAPTKNVHVAEQTLIRHRWTYMPSMAEWQAPRDRARG